METNKIRVKSIKYNFVMNALLTMSSVIFPLITFPYISRVLSPDGVGKVYFANSVVAYFTMFAQMGIPTYGIRACAKVRDDKAKLSQTVQEIFTINLVMTTVAYSLFFFTVLIIPRLRQDKLLFVIASFSMIFNTIGIEWLYKGLEQYSYITKRFVLVKIVSLIAVFALIRAESDYIMYCGICVFAGGASFVFNFFHARHLISFRPTGYYNFRQHLKPITVFFAMACATTIYTNFDNVMLGFMQSDTAVGYYNAAVKIKSILVSVVTSLGAVLLPRASYYIEHDMKDEFMRISTKAINFVFLLAMPLIVYFIIFAKESILSLSGIAYMNSILPMRIIMPAILIIGLSNIMGVQMLVPMGKEKIVLYSQIAGVTTNLIINSLLIPRLSSAGAAIGTVTAEIIVWIVQYAYTHTILCEVYKKIHYLRILLAIVIGSLASVWIKIFELYNLAALVLSAVLFFVVYAVVLIICREPLILEIIKQIGIKLHFIAR